MPARAPCPADPRKGLNLGLPDSGKKARSRDARVWQQGHRVAAESLETRPCQSLASARSRPLVLMRELSPGDSLTRPFIRDDAGGDSLDVADAAHVAAPTSSVLRALLKGFIVLGKQPAETLRFKAPSVQYGFLPSEAPDAPWPFDCWTGHQKRICSRADWRHSRLPLHACMYVHTALNLIGSMSTSVRRSSCRLLCRPTFGCNASAAQTLQARSTATRARSGSPTGTLRERCAVGAAWPAVGGCSWHGESCRAVVSLQAGRQAFVGMGAGPTRQTAPCREAWTAIEVALHVAVEPRRRVRRQSELGHAHRTAVRTAEPRGRTACWVHPKAGASRTARQRH